MPFLLDVAAVIAAVGVLALPGLAVVIPLRLRPLAAAGFLAPCSLALIAVSAEIGHLLHVPWSPATPAVLCAAPAVVVAVRRARRGRSARGGSRTGRAPVGARAVADRGQRSDSRGGSRPASDGVRWAERLDVARDDSRQRVWGAGSRPRADTPTDARAGSRSPSSPRATRHSSGSSAHAPAHRTSPSRRGERLALLAGLVTGGGILGVRMIAMMGSLHAVSQTYDGIFHLNAVRRILDLRSGSAWTVGGLTMAPGQSSFYPAAWHQSVSLVAMLIGGDIVRASDAVLFVVTVAIWPLGLVLLVRTCTSAGSLGLFATGALASVSLSFPMIPSAFGVLFPFVLTISLVPAGLTLLVQLFRWGAPGRSSAALTPLQALGLALPVALGIAVAHPQGVSSLIVLGLPVVVWACCVRVARVLSDPSSRVRRRAAVLTLAVGIAAFALTGAVWPMLRVARVSAGWDPTRTPGEAIAQTLTLVGYGSDAWWPMGAVFLAACVATVLLTRSGWLVASWLWAASAAVVALSMRDLDYRYLVTGTWYSDINRVTAIPIVVAIPILALGIEAIARWLLRRRARPRTPLAPVAAVVVVLSVLALGSLSPMALENYRDDVAPWWQNDGLLSPDERRLLEEVPALVPPGEIIAVDPWAGASLASAISDRPVTAVFPVGYRSPDANLIGDRLQDIQRDPAVCDAAERLGLHYVLDFGPHELWGMTGGFPGVDLVGDEPGAASVVRRHGDAALLRLEPCATSDGGTWG